MTFETLITFLTIENNKLNIHSDSDKRVAGTAFAILAMFSPQSIFTRFVIAKYRQQQQQLEDLFLCFRNNISPSFVAHAQKALVASHPDSKSFSTESETGATVNLNLWRRTQMVHWFNSETEANKTRKYLLDLNSFLCLKWYSETLSHIICFWETT